MHIIIERERDVCPTALHCLSPTAPSSLTPSTGLPMAPDSSSMRMSMGLEGSSFSRSINVCSLLRLSGSNSMENLVVARAGGKREGSRSSAASKHYLHARPLQRVDVQVQFFRSSSSGNATFPALPQGKYCPLLFFFFSSILVGLLLVLLRLLSCSVFSTGYPLLSLNTIFHCVDVGM